MSGGPPTVTVSGAEAQRHVRGLGAAGVTVLRAGGTLLR